MIQFSRLQVESQIDSKLDFKFWSQRNPDTPGFNPEILDLPGYSGYSFGYSGSETLYLMFWSFAVPKCYKTLLTLSRALSHSLPCLSLSLSLVLSFPQTIETQNPPSTLDPRPTGASLGWWIIYPACSIPGRLGFEPWCKEELTPR